MATIMQYGRFWRGKWRIWTCLFRMSVHGSSMGCVPMRNTIRNMPGGRCGWCVAIYNKVCLYIYKECSLSEGKGCYAFSPYP